MSQVQLVHVDFTKKKRPTIPSWYPSSSQRRVDNPRPKRILKLCHRLGLGHGNLLPPPPYSDPHLRGPSNSLDGKKTKTFYGEKIQNIQVFNGLVMIYIYNYKYI